MCKPSEFEISEHDVLDSRLSALEKVAEREKKSVVKKLSTYGGFVALLFSITIGAFTLLDKFYFEKVREIERKTTEIEQIVKRLTELNWQLVEFDLNNDSERMMTFGQLANGEKIALLERADKLSRDLEYNIRYSAAISFSFENLNFGSVEKSLQYAKIAESIAPSPASRAEAKRYIARVYLSPGHLFNIKRAQEEYTEGIDIAMKGSDLGSTWAVINSYRDWIFGEIYVGDCQMAKHIFSKAINYIGSLPGDLAIEKAFRTNINRIVTRQKRCIIYD